MLLRYRYIIIIRSARVSLKFGDMEPWHSPQHDRKWSPWFSLSFQTFHYPIGNIISGGECGTCCLFICSTVACLANFGGDMVSFFWISTFHQVKSKLNPNPDQIQKRKFKKKNQGRKQKDHNPSPPAIHIQKNQDQRLTNNQAENNTLNKKPSRLFLIGFEVANLGGYWQNK